MKFRLIFAFLLSMAYAVVALADGGVKVTGVTAQQRYPWNGKVDIVVTMQGASHDVADAECMFLASNSVTRAQISVSHITRIGTDTGSDTTWVRRFIWDAAEDAGAVKIDDVVLVVNADKCVQLWENGPYWAKCNVGATKPEEYGYYFWWGDTVGYKRNAANNGWASVKDGSSFDFYSSNCPTYGKDNSTLRSLGYIDSTGNLVAAHDAATAYLGIPWRMPTDAEFSALINNCTATWTTRNGVCGRLVTGKGDYSSKSIFLPAAGHGDGASHYDPGSRGICWASTPYSGYSGFACYLRFNSSYFSRYYSYRSGGRSVRPIRGFSEDMSGVAICGGFAAHLKLDCRTDSRVAAAEGEMLCYDTNWYDGASTIVMTDNGVEIGAGENGELLWHPTTCGGHTLQLKAVSSTGSQVGLETIEFVLNHVEVVTTAAEEPTCTESGCTKGSYCSRCNAVLATSTARAALGHLEVVTTAAKEPTCTEAGCTKGSYCSRCNETLATSQAVSALGHDVVETVAAREATCTEAGCTRGSNCGRCNLAFDVSQTIPALGHVETIIKEAVEPTYDSDGCTAGIQCSRCGVTLQESVALPRLTAAGVDHLDVEPISPWGKIVARYEVRGELPSDAESYRAFMVVKDMDSGTVACLDHVWGDRSLSSGWHNLVGDIASVKAGFRSTNCVVTVMYRKPKYYAIDFSEGKNAARYPVMDLLDVPADGWSEEYKTSKLLLRRVESGSFIMGSDQTDENHQVTISQPFCIGVFEVTQYQWSLFKSNGAFFYKWDARPIECVSYDQIRGSSLGAGWPGSSKVDADSYLGLLRERTGISFDLPTEAKWEYACRAGTTTAYNNGSDSDMGSVGRYCNNGGSSYSSYGTTGPSGGTALVGTYQPNAWGIYDMHGNVVEWCLDWAGALTYGWDPVGPATGTERCTRGGCYLWSAGNCTAYYRNRNGDPSSGFQTDGFRLVSPVPDGNETDGCSGMILANMPSADEVLCSKSSQTLAIWTATEGECVSSPVKLAYAPFAVNGRVDVCVGDELMLAADEEGEFFWESDAIGVQELVHRSEGIEWSVSVDVTNLNYRALSEPNPPEPIAADIIIPASKTFTSAKKSANTFAVSATNGTETWTASVSDDWITLTKTSGSVGVNKVVYSVAANTNADARTGFVYVCGQVHTIIQPGTGATLSTDDLSVDCHGTNRQVSVAVTVDGATWEARPEVSWISVQPTSGSGNGDVDIQVAPYYVVGTREGSVTVAGQCVTVSQRGRDMQLSCEETNITEQAQSIVLDVLAQGDVSWSVWDISTYYDDWVSVVGEDHGTGCSKVRFDVSANDRYVSRFAHIQIGTESVIIEQEGTKSPTFSLGATSSAVVAQGSQQSVPVLASPDLPWMVTTDSDWLTLSKTTDIGPVSFGYAVAANPNLTSRTGIMTFIPDPQLDQARLELNSDDIAYIPNPDCGLGVCTLVVTQSAAIATLSTTQVEVSADAIAVPIEVAVDPVVRWTVQNPNNWVTIEGELSQTGPNTVSLKISENTSLESRTCTLSIAGHDVEVRQEGGVVSLSRTSVAAVAAGEAVSVNVACSTKLNWSIQDVPSWVTIGGSMSRTGPTTLVLTVLANSGIEARDCELVIGGHKVLISQTAATTSVESDRMAYDTEVNIDSFTVTCPDYLAWTPWTTNEWITLTSEDSITGNGEVEYIVDETDATSSRIGIIWVGKTPVYVCQSGFETTLCETEKMVSRVSDDGQIAVDVEADEDEWCALSTVPWITVKTPSGTGDGFVQYSYEDNTTGVERVGRILVCDQVFTLTQTDADPSIPRWQISYENLQGATHANPNHYDEGDVLTFTAPTGGWTGYTFAGWDPSGIAAADTGDKTVRAIWTANAYSVVFDANGGTGEMANQAFVYDEAKALTACGFTRDGYAFLGWGCGKNAAPTWGDGVVVSNLTAMAGVEVRFYAQWTAVPYAITYVDTKEQPNANPSSYTITDAVVFAALGDVANFTFAGWTPTAIAVGTTGDQTVTANWNWVPSDGVVEAAITGGKPMDIKADWAKKELTQRFGAGKDRTFRERFGADFAAALTKPTGKRDGAGNELAVWHDYVAGTDPTDTNSVFKAKMEIKNGLPVVEWEPNLNSNGEERVYTVWGKTNLTDAAWHSPTNECSKFFKVDVAMPNEGTVSFNLSGASGSIDSKSIRVGQPIGDLPTPVRAGYDFLGWFTAAEGGDKVTADAIVTVDLSIYAHWKGSLLHRWSFNGNLNDSVGGVTAQYIGSASLAWTSDNKAISLAGGSHGQSGVNLGGDLLPTTGTAMTIEMWAKGRSLVAQCNRVFEIGYGMETVGKDTLQMMWWTSPTSQSEIMLMDEGSLVTGARTLWNAFTVGTEYHIAVRIEPGESSTTISFTRRVAATGANVETATWVIDSGWSLSDFRQDVFYLGRSLWSCDKDSAADYNEVRIWNRALTDDELTASVLSGPDAEL